MTEENRGTLTIAIWFLSAAALVALFISAAAQGELTTGHIAIAFTILASAIIGGTLMLRWKGNELEQEKTKHRRIDRLLNDMSDDELMELKQRLSDADDNAKSIADALGDDGELVRRR